MRSGEDSRNIGSGGGMETGFGWRQGFFVKRSEGLGKKALSRHSGKDGQIELLELVEAGEQRVVFAEPFAEAEAGVEDDFIAQDSGGDSRFDAFNQSRENDGNNVVRCERRKIGPVLRNAAGVHQDSAAAEPGTGDGHGGVPEVAADIVHDLGACSDGERGGGGMVGIDREDSLGLFLEDRFDDRKNAGLLLFGRERNGPGAGGFAADIEQVRAVVEHLQGLHECPFRGALRRVKVTSIGEAVRRHIENTHDQGPLPEEEGPGAETPIKAGTGGEGHGLRA